MAWTDPSGHVWAVSEVVTAANMNTYIQSNLSALQNFSTATVATTQSCTSTTYTDLVTSGPAVTVTTGTKALVIITAGALNSVALANNLMGYAVSGATTTAAADANAAFLISGSTTQAIRASYASIATLTAGSNTFTARYRTTATTASFSNREISVWMLPSA